MYTQIDFTQYTCVKTPLYIYTHIYICVYVCMYACMYINASSLVALKTICRHTWPLSQVWVFCFLSHTHTHTYTHTHTHTYMKQIVPYVTEVEAWIYIYIYIYIYICGSMKIHTYRKHEYKNIHMYIYFCNEKVYSPTAYFPLLRSESFYWSNW
jgi:hypothetical protein